MTEIRWTRSKDIDGRLCADNGLGLLNDKGVSVAIDRPDQRRSEKTWSLRVWGCTDRPRLENPIVVRFDTQRRAKQVAEQFLLKTRDRRYYSEYARYEMSRIESVILDVECQRIRAEIEHREAARDPDAPKVSYQYGTVTLASGERRDAKRMLLGDRPLGLVWTKRQHGEGARWVCASNKLTATFTPKED